MDKTQYSSESIRQIVDMLVDGTPLSKFPEDSHHQLLMPLSAAKNEAIVAGNTAQVKRIQAIMKSLKLGSPNSSKVSTPRRKNISERGFSPNDDRTEKSIDCIIEELIEGRAVSTIDTSMYRDIVRDLKLKKEQYLSEGDYRRSQKAEDIIQAINSMQYEKVFTSICTDKISNLNKQRTDIEEDLKRKEAFWDNQKNMFDEEKIVSLKKLEESHRVELEDFDKSFPEILPANFRKLSATVLQLREQEKHLVLTKRYDDAIAYKERADKLEAQELQMQRDKFNRAFHQRREQLISSHRIQMKCFEDNWRRKLEKLEKDRSCEIKPVLWAKLNLQKKIIEAENGNVDDGSLPRARLNSRSVLAEKEHYGSPTSIHPRVRTVAASRMTSRPVLSRVYPLR